MVSPINGSGKTGGADSSGRGTPPGRITLPTGAERAVSIISDDGKVRAARTASSPATSSPGFLGRIATVASLILWGSGSEDEPVSSLSAGRAVISESARASFAPSPSITYTSDSGANRALSVSDLPSAARTAREYGEKLMRLFSEPSSKITIQLDPNVDVIGRPALPSLDDAVNRLTNMWRDGSFKGIDGHVIPSHETFAAQFRTDHGGENPKIADYRAFVRSWQENTFSGVPEGRRIERMDAAYRMVKDAKQTAKDLGRKATMSVDGRMAPDLSVAGAGVDPLEATTAWITAATAGIADETAKLRVISSLQQGILAPVNQMADLLFNREFSEASDGAMIAAPVPRTPAHLEALKRNEAVPPNIKEWKLSEERGLGVVVDSRRGVVKAKLYFDLKGNPDVKFEGNITVDVRTGAASLEIVRVP